MIRCLTCDCFINDYESNHRKYCSADCYWQLRLSNMTYRFINGKWYRKKCDDCDNWVQTLKTKCCMDCASKRERMSFAKLNYKGSKHWNWKGGITPLNKSIRHSGQMAQWRKAVFERDNYTCQICSQVGYKLQADHIKPFSTHPELRFDLDNGRTLCYDCHRKTPTWGRKALYAS